MGLIYIRNRVICKVFWKAGYVEKLGSGFITLFENYEERSSKEKILLSAFNQDPLFPQNSSKEAVRLKKFMSF